MRKELKTLESKVDASVNLAFKLSLLKDAAISFLVFAVVLPQDLEGSGVDGNSGFRPVLPRGPPVRTFTLTETFLGVTAELSLILMHILALRVFLGCQDLQDHR